MIVGLIDGRDVVVCVPLYNFNFLNYYNNLIRNYFLVGDWVKCLATKDDMFKVGWSHSILITDIYSMWIIYLVSNRVNRVVLSHQQMLFLLLNLKMDHLIRCNVIHVVTFVVN